jgi:hypothetical protein
MDTIRINQAAQGVRSLAETRLWFCEHSSHEQRALIQEVGYLALQAGAVPEDAALAASYAAQKRGSPACVLMSKGVPKVQLSKILELPDEENLRSFSFLVGLLSVADARRRQTSCATGCQHWWHRNLREKAVVDDILNSGEAG